MNSEPQVTVYITAAPPNQESLRAYAEALLDRAVKEVFGVDAHTLEIKQGQRGKPYFPARPDICFNISHAGGYAVCAVSSLDVGVDIEVIQPIRTAMVERWLGRFADTGAALTDIEATRAWTRFESYGKFTGAGLMHQPDVKHVFYEYGGLDGYIVTVCAGGQRDCTFVVPDKHITGSF